MAGQGTAILGIRSGNYLRGIGGWITETPNTTSFHFNANVSGNTLTFVKCASVTHYQSSNHSVYTNQIITTIIGIV